MHAREVVRARSTELERYRLQVQIYAEAIARAYRDEALWNRIAAAGLENVRRHFSPEAARHAIGETLAMRPSHADVRPR